MICPVCKGESKNNSTCDNCNIIFDDDIREDSLNGTLDEESNEEKKFNYSDDGSFKGGNNARDPGIRRKNSLKINQEEIKKKEQLKQLIRCMEEDSTSRLMLLISRIWLNIGIVIATVQFLVIMILGFTASSPMFGSFIFTFILSGSVNFLIIFGSAWLSSLLLKGAAHIVQNTKNSAKILEYQTKLLIENQAEKISG